MGDNESGLGLSKSRKRNKNRNKKKQSQEDKSQDPGSQDVQPSTSGSQVTDSQLSSQLESTLQLRPDEPVKQGAQIAQPVHQLGSVSAQSPQVPQYRPPLRQQGPGPRTQRPVFAQQQPLAQPVPQTPQIAQQPRQWGQSQQAGQSASWGQAGQQQASQYGQQRPQVGQQRPQFGQQRPQVGQQRPQTAQSPPWGQTGQQMPQTGQSPSWGQTGQQMPQTGQSPPWGQTGQPAQWRQPQSPQSGQQVPHAGQQAPQSVQQMPQAGQQRPQTGQQRPQAGQQMPQTSQQALQTTQQASQPGQQKPPSGTYSTFIVPKRVEGTGNKRYRNPVQLLTNYLEMQIKPMVIYRYDATISPEKPKKAIPVVFRTAIAMKFPQFQNCIAFDQRKNFYSPKPLPNVTESDRFVINVDYKEENGKISKFEVSLKGTGKVDSSSLMQHMSTGGTSLNPPTEVIQCIDVVLRHGTLDSYVKAGRQFFKRPARPIDLGDGLEMWTGLFQSAIFTSRPFVNIDVAHKGFPIQQSMISLIKSFKLDPTQPLDFQRGRGLETFTGYVKGLKVVATSLANGSKLRREYICNSMVQPANRQMFILQDQSTGHERKISVADYFRENGTRMQYPNLNCMWVGPRDKTIYVPMEILEVSYGQVRNKQLNEFQLSKMVREAATPPDIRKAKIEEVIKDMKYSNNKFFETFGLKISEQFTNVEGKVLFAPKLACGGGTATPRNGVWKSDRLLQGSTLSAWGLIAVGLDPHAANFNTIINSFKNTGRNMGMNIDEPKLTAGNIQLGSLEEVMRSAVQKQLQMLVVVVSTRLRDVYMHVKTVAERSVGVLTQCIKDNTAQRKLNEQTIRNILLKVNSKLMGVNYAIDRSCLPVCLQSGGVMVVGADVTHPSPDQSNIPSIAAVTASIDDKCFKYNLEFSIQTPKKEMIVDLENIMVDHLKVYREYNNNKLPHKIYVFRDGVSEGQFAEVMRSELQAVYAAYRRMAGLQARPEVLFLLVQKRHHTRFFIKNSNQNVEPGTVVDSLIVHPKELDFYLVSHYAIKGTARPTRYHAVCNDGSLPHDEVEQLVYYLCHLYSRCTRAVSYPAPTYYAHLACLRARTLTMGDTFNNEELSNKPVRLRVLPRVQNPSRMFFV